MVVRGSKVLTEGEDVYPGRPQISHRLFNGEGRQSWWGRKTLAVGFACLIERFGGVKAGFLGEKKLTVGFGCLLKGGGEMAGLVGGEKVLGRI